MSVKYRQTTHAETTKTEQQTTVDQRAKNEAPIRLLQSWRESDEEDEPEQRETWESLKHVLDEDRWLDRKLFR